MVAGWSAERDELALRDVVTGHVFLVEEDKLLVNRSPVLAARRVVARIGACSCIMLSLAAAAGWIRC